MALLLTVATGAWAQDPDPIDLTPSADGTVWTLSTMPEYDVELEVTYYTDAELDQMAADEVIAKITAIGTVTYTPESKALIDAARTAYDALTAAQQALVTNYSTLTDAETTYATAEETAYTEGVELTKNPDGTWSLAATPAFDVEIEVEYDTDYAKSINIEQLVLDNGKNYDIAKAFLENYVDAHSINALDSLNDEKILRNEPYLGLKLKTEGASVKVLVEAGKTLKVKFGFIGEAVKVLVDGIQGESIEATTEGCVEEFAAAEADRVIEFVTSSNKTVVVKQIMVGEAIKDVVLPAATRYEVKIADGIANGTVSFDATSKKDSKGYVTVAVGDEVTITATPDEGYKLQSLAVTGVTTDQAIIVTDNKFTMPTNDAVTINATFEATTAVSEVKAAAGAQSAGVKKYFKDRKLVIEGANGSEFDAAGAQVK